MRPGKRPSGEEVARVLRHVIARIRRHWPNVQILVRGDSHYCSQPALALLEAMRCDYIIGFAINSKLLQGCPGNDSMCRGACPAVSGANRVLSGCRDSERDRACDFAIAFLDGC